jgi:hypothetical protein
MLLAFSSHLGSNTTSNELHHQRVTFSAYIWHVALYRSVLQRECLLNQVSILLFSATKKFKSSNSCVIWSSKIAYGYIIHNLICTHICMYNDAYIYCCMYTYAYVLRLPCFSLSDCGAVCCSVYRNKLGVQRLEKPDPNPKTRNHLFTNSTQPMYIQVCVHIYCMCDIQ